ncbi:helix-turn-helix domain-containing protein [Allomuricauda sp. SCSIO 65647]|uniref:helix-turn-helix domain-containing protein n=1 Tax=Allomuricauda sp. SCSIO 65647 TaxID=2908843 RepID=UPI001F38795B|nr:helix-turn-helix domain-containing protein [Muricauda sp. SCSIO 65647]UJH67864.1 helix-turn-helix domain-containing protein [Muricauda sp. SCSIO 65647]
MQVVEGLSRDQEFLNKLKQIVLDNIRNEQFGVEHLSKEIGISRSQLYRRLQSLKGQSISYFIREIRMEEAIKLLRKDAATVSEIAYRVGFNTPSYFHKCFHDYYGYSPGEVKHMGGTSGKKDETVFLIWKNRLILFFSRRMVIILIAAVFITGLISIKYSAISPKGENEIRSIAILPLKPLSKDKDQSYLALGMHDAIIGELGKISGLRVISKTSTLPYLDATDKLLPDIAKELGVQAIVEGSVFISGDSIRLQLQLIEVFPRERHLWAQEYYEQIANVLNVQSQLVQKIAAEVNVNLTPDESKLLKTKRSVDPEIYKHYLRGMYHLNRGTRMGFDQGIAHLKKALELDPADPFAYAGLALGYAISGHGQVSKRGVMQRAGAAAKQALRLDPNIIYGHTALALVGMYNEWDWESAKESFDTAIRINPNDEFAHAHLAWLYLLMGENELAVQHAEIATEINPLYPTYQLWLGWIHQMSGNHEKAVQKARDLLEFEPNFTFAHFIIGSVYYDQRNYHKALREYEKIGWKNDLILSAIGGAHANLGNKKKALEIAKEMDSISNMEFVNPVYKAFLRASLNQKDSAMAYLNEAYHGKMYPLPWVKCVDEFNIMKKDSAFIRLQQKMNLTL